MKTIPLLYIFSVVTLLAGDQPESFNVTTKNMFTFYGQFKRLTKEPHTVSPAMAGGCAGGFFVNNNKRQPRTTDPHFRSTNQPVRNPSIHVYVNPLADDAITQKSKVFPVGAIIVKEKLDDNRTVIGVGGMIKRAAGFDPKKGDWEYFMASKAGSLSKGRMQNCADCHSNAKDRDYVFYLGKPYN